MAAEMSITLTLGYTGTDFTRKYKFNNVTQEACENAKAKILEYNADIPAADKNVFISDDYNGTIGKFDKITAAQYEVVEYERINLN